MMNIAMLVIIVIGAVITGLAYAAEYAAEENKSLSLSRRILAGFVNVILLYGLVALEVVFIPSHVGVCFAAVLLALGVVQLIIAGRQYDYSMTFVAFSATLAILMWLTVGATAYRDKFFALYAAVTVFPIAVGIAKNIYFNKKQAGQLANPDEGFRPVTAIIVTVLVTVVCGMVTAGYTVANRNRVAAGHSTVSEVSASTAGVTAVTNDDGASNPVTTGVTAEAAELEEEEEAAVVALASDTNLTASPSANGTVQLSADAEMEKALTVDLEKYNELRNIYSEYPNKFMDSSMPNRYKDKKVALQNLIDKGVLKLKQPFSDAVAFPFSNTEEKKGVHSAYKDEDLADMKEELILELKGNPVFLDMTLRGLKEVELTTDKTIGDLNPWMGEFVDTMDKAMEHAADIRQQLATINTDISLNHEEKKAKINKLDLHPRGNEYWLTVDPATGGYVTTITEDNVAGYNYYADRACMFIFDCCNCLGVDEYTSKVNYALQACMDADIARTERLDKEGQQDSLALLAFSYDRKNGDREILYGFNIFDKRFELFDRKAIPKRLEKPKKVTSKPKPKPAPAPVPTPVIPQAPIPQAPAAVPSSGSSGGGHGDGGGHSGGGGGNTPHLEVKDPTQDPVNQGNAQQGGGKNLPTDGTGVYQPTEPPHQDNDAPNGYNPASGPEASQPESEAGKHETVHNNEPVVNHDENKDSSPTPVSDDDGGGKKSGSHNGSMSAPD